MSYYFCGYLGRPSIDLIRKIYLVRKLREQAINCYIQLRLIIECQIKTMAVLVRYPLNLFSVRRAKIYTIFDASEVLLIACSSGKFRIS